MNGEHPKLAAHTLWLLLSNQLKLAEGEGQRMGGDRGAVKCACAEGFGHYANSFDLRELRACAVTRFAGAGIGLHYVDTAVLTFVIADNNGSIINPLGYCLAVGRRLQDESNDGRENRRREFEALIGNTCPHGSSVERCGQCARDRQRALDLFPSLRRYLPASLTSTPSAERRT